MVAEFAQAARNAIDGISTGSSCTAPAATRRCSSWPPAATSAATNTVAAAWPTGCVSGGMPGRHGRGHRPRAGRAHEPGQPLQRHHRRRLGRDPPGNSPARRRCPGPGLPRTVMRAPVADIDASPSARALCRPADPQRRLLTAPLPARRSRPGRVTRCPSPATSSAIPDLVPRACRPGPAAGRLRPPHAVHRRRGGLAPTTPPPLTRRRRPCFTGKTSRSFQAVVSPASITP